VFSSTNLRDHAKSNARRQIRHKRICAKFVQSHRARSVHHGNSAANHEQTQDQSYYPSTAQDRANPPVDISQGRTRFDGGRERDLRTLRKNRAILSAWLRLGQIRAPISLHLPLDPVSQRRSGRRPNRGRAQCSLQSVRVRPTRSPRHTQRLSEVWQLQFPSTSLLESSEVGHSEGIAVVSAHVLPGFNAGDQPTSQRSILGLGSEVIGVFN
jgi:hypothetical protein